MEVGGGHSGVETGGERGGGCGGWGAVDCHYIRRIGMWSDADFPLQMVVAKKIRDRNVVALCRYSR